MLHMPLGAVDGITPPGSVFGVRFFPFERLDMTVMEGVVKTVTLGWI